MVLARLGNTQEEEEEEEEGEIKKRTKRKELSLDERIGLHYFPYFEEVDLQKCRLL